PRPPCHRGRQPDGRPPRAPGPPPRPTRGAAGHAPASRGAPFPSAPRHERSAAASWSPRVVLPSWDDYNPAELRRGPATLGAGSPRGLKMAPRSRLHVPHPPARPGQGRISFYIKSTGEEAVAVAQGMALQPTDMLFPSYRQQGLHVVRGRNLVDLMCQCLSNTRDMCKGRQMPIMYHWGSGNIFTISG